MKKIMMSPLLMTAVLFAHETGAEEATSDGGGIGTWMWVGIAAVAVAGLWYCKNNC